MPPCKIEIEFLPDGQLKMSATDGAVLIQLLGMLDVAREMLLSRKRGQQPKASPILIARGGLPPANGSAGK